MENGHMGVALPAGDYHTEANNGTTGDFTHDGGMTIGSMFGTYECINEPPPLGTIYQMDGIPGRYIIFDGGPVKFTYVVVGTGVSGTATKTG